MWVPGTPLKRMTHMEANTFTGLQEPLEFIEEGHSHERPLEEGTYIEV